LERGLSDSLLESVIIAGCGLGSNMDQIAD
jgi:hypothetical protein